MADSNPSRRNSKKKPIQVYLTADVLASVELEIRERGWQKRGDWLSGAIRQRLDRDRPEWKKDSKKKRKD